ncbi:uncharacterized protein N7503_003467 [Penicillium pulvis]|uniref:uncharacterized protein n=1 Tax=Penicillium pulvis TaxID=1562058 RepID=UPI00254990BF|nr:uncharacterized protein N7503_003467 [Penicillium pulvis]KAJ5805865.1 hypothetical protein N7503_003467 [Penicillium pulvis]
MGKAFPGPETGLWRIVLRLISLFGSVFGIIASTAGAYYPINSFWYYLFFSICGFWSLIVLGFLCFKLAPHPGCCIAFDLLLIVASAWLVAVAGIGITYDYTRWMGRDIASLVFALIVFVDHFMMFVLACIDVDKRRRLHNPKAPYREVSPGSV